MNDLKALSELKQKRTEGVQTYLFQLMQNNRPAFPEDKYRYVASFATSDSLVKQVDMKINQGLIEFDSDQILDLPAGVYRLEIYEMINDAIHAIFPSDRDLKFNVLYNTLDLPTGKVSSLTLDEFKKQFTDLAKRISTGTFESPKFKSGEVTTVDPDQPASVEMVTADDGTVTINYHIPRGKDGDSWKPYIAKDGHWHIKLLDKPTEESEEN